MTAQATANTSPECVKRFLVEGRGWTQVVEAHSPEQAVRFLKMMLAGTEGILVRETNVREISELEYRLFLFNGMPNPGVAGYGH